MDLLKPLSWIAAGVKNGSIKNGSISMRSLAVSGHDTNLVRVPGQGGCPNTTHLH